MPTLLSAPELRAPDGLDGVDLLPAIRGERIGELWAYAESGREFVGVDQERHLPGVEGKQRMVRTQRWKLILIPHRNGREYRLFDLRTDAGEERDAANRHPETVEPLSSLLEDLLASEDGAARPDAQLSDEQIEQLRSLGYL